MTLAATAYTQTNPFLFYFFSRRESSGIYIQVPGYNLFPLSVLFNPHPSTGLMATGGPHHELSRCGRNTLGGPGDHFGSPQDPNNFHNTKT